MTSRVAAVLLCGFLSVVRTSGGELDGNLTKYIMWIPGRAGSTWATEMLARSHPRILAETERFSGQAQSCRDGGASTPECVAKLEDYWGEPLADNVVARGFKVRPIMGWNSREMLGAYAERTVRFVCNNRLDTLRHGISMYRHVLSRNHHSQTWHHLMQRYPNSAHNLNGTRITIPTAMISPNVKAARQPYTKHLTAECIINFGPSVGRNLTRGLSHSAVQRIEWETMWLSDCAQNITSTMFEYLYSRAEKLMKSVSSICLDYASELDGSVHWLSYESMQRGPQLEVDRMAAFLTGARHSTAPIISTPSGWTEHKVTANLVATSVPNIESIAASWWDRSSCSSEGFISDTFYPKHLHGSGVIPSTHSILALLFNQHNGVVGPARSPPGNADEGPFVVIGSGLQWVGRLFAAHSGVRHAVINEQGRPENLPRNATSVRCDGGCSTSCQKTTMEFIQRESTIQSAPSAAVTGVTIDAHSLTSWNTKDRAADPLIRVMVKRRVRLVCAVWENGIEGGLARLHGAKLKSRGIDPLHRCSPHDIEFADAVPNECVNTLTADEFRAAVNAVAIETFATLRYCRDYALLAGSENVFVVGHRPDTTGSAKRTLVLSQLADFVGLPPWDHYKAAGHLFGSYHRFFPDLATVLRDVLRTEVDTQTNMIKIAKEHPIDWYSAMCIGCDAYSVADTLALIAESQSREEV